MTIRLYSGEYLKSPYLLHFGLNWCTHGCVYCFANLNKPDRRGTASDIGKMVKWLVKGSTSVEGKLLRAGHPVLIANDSDPCAKSNTALFQAVHNTLDPLGVKFGYQTRGGDPEAEALIVNGPTATIYVSVTTDDDDWRKKHEPGAPSYESRLDFIRRCADAGHNMILGINPIIPDAWVDFESSVKRLIDAVRDHPQAWVESLHLSSLQVAQMSEKTQERFSALIADARRKKQADPRVFEMVAWLESQGVNVYSGGTSTNGNFWKPHFDIHPWTPTLDEIVSVMDGRLIDINWLNSFCEKANLPTNNSAYKSFIQPFGRTIRKFGPEPKVRSIADVNAWFLRMDELPTCFRNQAFALIEKGADYAKVSGVPVLEVKKSGHKTWSIKRK